MNFIPPVLVLGGGKTSVEEQFMWLLRFAKVKRIKDFLSRIPSIDARYPTPDLRTPLTSAIDRGDPQILSLLLERNSTSLDDTTTQPYGRTALMHASYVARSPEILRVLLNKGAELGKVDARGWTCLQYAIIGGRTGIVMHLLNAGAPIDGKDFQGRTPLMVSDASSFTDRFAIPSKACRSSVDVLRLLLDRGADIGARDNAGLTALQIAILRRKRDAAVLLLERGSDARVVAPTTGASIGELCRTCMPDVLRCLEPKSGTLPRPGRW